MKKLQPSYFFDLADFQHKKIFENCGYVWEALPKIGSYLKNNALGKIEVDVPENVYLIDPESISIGIGTVLEPGAYIKGPCIIGKNCVVRHGAYIRGNLIAGNNCVIGHDSEIKNAIFLNDAHAAHFAYVGDSILGNAVNLGAGTKCANLKFDNSAIAVFLDNQKVETGLRKFGAIFGDGSQTGCNSVTNPGTLFGKNTCCYPCMNVGGFVESDQLIKPSHHPVITPRSSSLKHK
jgi:UDP-N-acetylglucosamine diphosphorylase / glucose-1-phosphate thymidylyltransferase / UDP-N-acetylgalactosamine diphosphorylase / glucosamine-1-phosphate N-acetyltransferase / galactosamine-1-phosphate N-acetyltransferase